MVGSRRLELPTSSVSRKRSNQLSYEPVFSTTWLFLGGSSEPLLRTRGEARSDTKGFYHRAPVHPERDVSVATLELYDRAWPTEQMVKRIGELRDRGISPVSVNTYLRRIDAYFNCSDGV